MKQEGGEGRQRGEEEEEVVGYEQEGGKERGERRRRVWLGVRQEGGEGREGGEERGVEGKVQMEEGQADLVTTISVQGSAHSCTQKHTLL